MLLYGNAAKAQPVISSVYPSGAYQFQNSQSLSFIATSPATITNISVQLIGTKLTGGSASLSFLSGSLGVDNGLTVTGIATSNNVSALLTSNVIYSAVIQVADANGNTTSSSLTFDTIAPVYTWEAVDWDDSDLTPNYFDNPQTNKYSGLPSISGTDYNNTSPGSGAASYRPQGLETENPNSTGDTPRVQYINTTNIDYDVGYNNGGNWGNYTRHYPAGTYHVFLRGSNGGGSNPQNDACSLAVVGDSASFGGSGPYQFSIPNGGWSTWHWVPLIDSSSGNPAEITFDGTASTLRLNIDGGNCNEHFFMLVPTNSNPIIPSSVILTNIYPDGVSQFEQTNTFVFTANSPLGIASGNIVVQLTGTNLIGQGSSVILTAGNGLTVTGVSTNWNVSFSLATNTMYSAFIQTADANGGVTSTNINFDTVYPNYYTFEAEDFDYSGGQFVPPPQTNGYFYLNGENQVDYNCPTESSDAYQRIGLGTESGSYQLRPQYDNTGFNNFDVGSVNGGDWGNYTRVYPAGAYNVYIRAANGNNNNNSDSASLSVVTPAAPSTSSQTLTKVGTFAVPFTHGWQTYTWVPLKNSGGGLARVSFDGVSVNTLRATTDQGSYNADYYMLVPADNTIKEKPYVSNFQPDGSALFQATNLVAFGANSEVGLTTGNITMTLNGANASGMVFTPIPGQSGNWNVTCPVRPNIYYTAIITLTDANGTSMSTNIFGTFNATNYQFEAEDYDYNGGSFYDVTAPPDSYNALGSVANIDNHQADLGANPFDYRASTTQNPAPATTPSGDLPRAQFTAVGATDYNIGFFGIGSWANYTRHYPAGTYNVVGRFAEGAGITYASMSIITNGAGTSIQSSNYLGQFTIQNEGWGTWQWSSLLDANGNLAQITLDGSTNTLQLAGQSGNEVNVNFLMLVPADTSRPVINNLSPNGSSLFESSNALTFAVSSTAGIITNNVELTLNGVIVTNLVFSGSSTAWNVSYPGLPANGVYTAVISVTSQNGETVSATNSFDTINASNYQWEAEDYDYSSAGAGGLFFDNPQVDSYANLPGLTNVDLLESDLNAFGRGNSYRPAGYGNFPDTSAGDKSRAQFTGSGKTDWSIGSFGGGSWANYTRHYPPGTYNVMGRFAEGAGTSIAALAQLTSGYATTNQRSSTLGTFTIPNEGWGTWQWVPLLNNNGEPAKVTLDGSQSTLQLQGLNNNEANVNFFVLTPTSPAPTLKASVSGNQVNLLFFAQTGYNYQVQYTTSLTDPVWTSLGSPVAGNNTNNVVTDTLPGTGRFYRIHP